ncbi:MAG: response regulator [Rhodospirillales bacterium]|nr:response regulator [Rhodospirillales bacterium]
MSYRFENASVLVVDDMNPMLSLVASLLRIFGFKNVYTATNGEEAFKKFRKYNPDIVLTDWLMEPMDGIKLAEQIRKDPSSPNKFVPIVMMTGYSHRIRVEQSRDMGITEFLVKPFTSRDLYARIERLVEKPRKFVDSGEFFGPDRRRKRPKEYVGPYRRDGDEDEDAVGADMAVQANDGDGDGFEIDLVDRDKASQILRELREKAKSDVN